MPVGSPGSYYTNFLWMKSTSVFIAAEGLGQYTIWDGRICCKQRIGSNLNSWILAAQRRQWPLHFAAPHSAGSVAIPSKTQTHLLSSTPCCITYLLYWWTPPAIGLWVKPIFLWLLDGCGEDWFHSQSSLCRPSKSPECLAPQSD